jgi:hypothetical protein
MDYSSLISFAVGGNAYGSTADTNSRKFFVSQATNKGEEQNADTNSWEYSVGQAANKCVVVCNSTLGFCS